MSRKLIRDEGLLCGKFTDQVISFRFSWYCKFYCTVMWKFITPSLLVRSNCVIYVFNLPVLLQEAALAQSWQQQ